MLFDGAERLVTDVMLYLAGILHRHSLRHPQADKHLGQHRMDTDVISGMESGMNTVLVLSGVSTRETLKTYAYRPTMVLSGVGDIPALAKKTE